MDINKLYIDNKLADTTSDLKYQIDKIVTDFRDPLKVTSTHSLSITLPYTNKNKSIFFNEQDRQLLGKFKRSYTARLERNGNTIIAGEFLLLQTTPAGFEGAVGVAGNGDLKLGDIIKNKNLNQIKSFQKLDFSGHDYVSESWNTVTSYPDSEVCFPYVLPSYSKLRTSLISHYEDLGVSHFAAAIVKAIFADAGYTVEGDIFNDASFLKLIVLFSNSDAQKSWNFGKLLPLNAQNGIATFFGGVYNSTTIKKFERQNDIVYILSYPFDVVGGDAPICLTNGVYTSKFTGLYNITVQARHSAILGNGAEVPSAAFTVLRCIDNEETITDTLLPASFSSVPPLSSLDRDTLLVTGTDSVTADVRLVADKQYVIQRYISIPKSIDSNTYTVLNTHQGVFKINSVNAPVLLDPALFLPQMKQAEFIADIFKIFNLFYQADTNKKEITLFTRDDFFQETLQDVIDITPFVDGDSLTQIPLSTKDISQTYLTYLTDESDAILNGTDYMKLVNGEVPEGSTKLNFAPIGFLRLKYKSKNQIAYDLLPAILSVTDTDDISVLDDNTLQTDAGSWVPRLALYQGAGWLKTDIEEAYDDFLYKVKLGRYVQGSGFGFNLNGGNYEYDLSPPRLSFFDITNQPAYELTQDVTFRSFSLTKKIGDNIYTNLDDNYLANTNRVPELDIISLAANVDSTVNPKGLFYQLYSNDLLISNLSNYLQGVGRMNEVLFNKLTGRQVLRLDSDLYLLDSINNYDVNAELATYKFYKLVANTGTNTGGLTRYTSTQTYTATCPTNTTGEPVTKTATRTSYISSQDAIDKAFKAAKELANLNMICITPGGGIAPPVGASTWTGTQSCTVTCANNVSPNHKGEDVTSTITYVSYVSQDDADTQSYWLSFLDAVSKLVCTL